MEEFVPVLFNIANKAILPAWVALAFFPKNRKSATVIKVSLFITAMCYVISLLQGDYIEGASFTTLEGVTTIFRMGDASVLNACWTHYLCFDLVVGMVINRDSLRCNLHRWVVVPCLFATLMYGPAGFLLYNIMKYIFLKKLIDF